MRWTNRALGFLVLSAAGLAAPRLIRSRTPQQLQLIPMLILRCHDGDTCTARSPEGVLMTLRLAGIDAPEVGGRRRGGQWEAGQSYGFEAAKRIRELAVGHQVLVELRGHDIYRRYLAVLWDSTHKDRFNERLVKEGYAFAYRGAHVDPDIAEWAEAAERNAQKDRRGFWNLPENKRPEEPRRFRHRKKN